MAKKLLLIGCGRFGRNHLRALKELHSEDWINLAGVYMRNPKKGNLISGEFGVKVFRRLTPRLLQQVDAVDIVAPPSEHFELVKTCLYYTNVFVEKPLAESSDEAEHLAYLAERLGRLLVVGHIFRFHPVSRKLLRLFQGSPPASIRGTFVNPAIADQGREASFELLHLFDIIDFIWEKRVKALHTYKVARSTHVDLRYEGGFDARIELGWRDQRRERNLLISTDGATMQADFLKNTVIVELNKVRKRYYYPTTINILKKELLSFAKLTSLNRRDEITAGSNARMAARIVRIAEHSIRSVTTTPRVAIIGGGIYGTSVAAEIGECCETVLFERNSRLLQEASSVNQLRHHNGYHYPRSEETVRECRTFGADFENVFNEAIVKTCPTYYSVAKRNSRISPTDFVAFCNTNDLPFKNEQPPSGTVARERIALSVRVPEASYCHSRIRDIVYRRLSQINTLTLNCGTTVLACSLEPNGEKTVTFKTSDQKIRATKADFVINATYANINSFSAAMKFPIFPVRIDVVELLILDLPIDPISLTVVDGPFATLAPTGNPHEFTLYHVTESILRRYAPHDGCVRKNKTLRSNRRNILNESTTLFPILKHARLVESKIISRVVEANREYDDSRITNVIDHGFGCWSILSGKILSSVSIGRKLASLIRERSL